MNLKPDQLEYHLRQQFLPLYLIAGDEPLQVKEMGDSVRAAARVRGFAEREVLEADSAAFNWGQLQQVSSNLSLFAEQRIIELRLPTGKPGKIGAEALLAYAGRAPQDIVLLIISGKLESASRKAKWYQALERLSVVIQCWPPASRDLPRWIDQRMRTNGLQPEREVAALLAERVEGNLLAAAQEIDKLLLLYGEGAISPQQVTAAVADSARYNIYDLVDSVLAGDVVRSARIVSGLESEGVEIVLALWALTREVRALAGIAETMDAIGLDAALSKAGVWDSRKMLIKKALQRHPPEAWMGFLASCAHIDRVTKGMAKGRPWQEFGVLSTRIATAGKSRFSALVM